MVSKGVLHCVDSRRLPSTPADARRAALNQPTLTHTPSLFCPQVLLSLPSFVADLRHGRAALTPVSNYKQV